jgi:hypothetical protein
VDARNADTSLLANGRRLLPEDLVDGSGGDRDHEEVAVRTGLDVRADAEAATEQQTLALGDVVLRTVVGDPVLQAWIVDGDLLPVAGQVEAEEVAAGGQRRGRTDEEVVGVLGPSALLDRKPIPAGGTANFQLNSGSL